MWDEGYVKAPIILEIPETNQQPLPKRVGNGSCIDYIKWRLNITETLNNPYYLWQHSADFGFSKTELKLNTLVVLAEGYAWHIAYVEEIESDTFTISEQNYPLNNGISRRDIPINSDRIVGFLKSS